jgi:hypothetical protein
MSRGFRRGGEDSVSGIEKNMDTSRRTPPDFGCHWSYPTSAGLAAAVPHWSGTTSGTPMESNRLPQSGFRQMAVLFVSIY